MKSKIKKNNSNLNFIFLFTFLSCNESVSNNTQQIIETVIENPCNVLNEKKVILFLDFYLGQSQKAVDSTIVVLEKENIIDNFLNLDDNLNLVESGVEFSNGRSIKIKGIPLVMFYDLTYLPYPCSALKLISLKPYENLAWGQKEFKKLLNLYKSKYSILSEEKNKIVFSNEDKAIIFSNYDKEYYVQYRTPSNRQEQDENRARRAINRMNGSGGGKDPNYFSKQIINSFQITYCELKTYFFDTKQENKVRQNKINKEKRILNKIDNGI